MRSQILENEAEECRRKAIDYAGKPEAQFLLRLARSFDELASQHVLPRATVQDGTVRFGRV